MLALPWLATALWLVVGSLRREVRALGSPGRVPIDGWLCSAGAVAVPMWASVAGLALVDTCVGHGWLGFGEPILRLTVVHFTFVGAGATTLALAALAGGATWARRIGLVLVLVAPPIVGLGFTSGLDAAEVGGPILLAAGVYLVAGATLRDGWVLRRELRGALLVASGLSPWAPMVLAVAWALAPHTGGPALSLPDMVRLHGGAQAMGFIGCGLLGRRVDLPVVRWGQVDAEVASDLLTASRSASPTSGDLVVTADGAHAAGGFARSRVVGSGREAFVAAADAVRTLAPQRAVATVIPASATASLGDTLLVVLRFGPVTLVAVNLVVWVVDEPGRWGFAYATLPGHPERGQESFVVTLDADGEVTATITAVAHAAVPFGRWTGPLARPVQQRVAERYLDAIAVAVDGAAVPVR